VNVPGGFFASCLQDVLVSRPGVIALTFLLHNLQGIRRTDIQAGAQTIAVDLFDQNSLILVVKHKSPLGTGCGAKAAAVAEVSIDFDDLSFGHDDLSFVRLTD
jgi:hypothetical protein